MEKDFSVGQANELVKGGITYDLHNCYDFGGITISSTRHAQMWFTPNVEHGKDSVSIVIDVEGVDYVELSNGVAVGSLRDVDEIGYKSPGDRDLDWLVGERQATDNDHLVFSLGPSDHIRIHGQRMRLRECGAHYDPLKAISE